MNQAVYFTNNQYDPKIIEQMFHQIHEKSWDYCMQVQKSMCRHRIIGGPMIDFVCDESLNLKMGFPEGSYSLFTPQKIIKQETKYVIEHFYRKKELISLLDIIQNPRFKYMLICHLAEFIYMNLKCLPTKNGTYLVITTDTETGITKAQIDFMIWNYNNPYTENRWWLEIRPKVTTGYFTGTILNNIVNRRIYFSDCTSRLSCIDVTDLDLDDWKVAISDVQGNQNLLRVSFADIKYDETDGRPYLEISETFNNHISSITNNVNVFLYNEGHKVGYTISPNYLGPTQYLKDVFDEIFASVDSRRFKVMIETPEGGWITLGATDTQFGSSVADLITVGFSQNQCWVAIPSKSGVSPIYEGNFRVWEYDTENDCLGRVLETEVDAKFPNLYLYKLKSDSFMLYIEWFRDDESIGEDYDDFTKGYRDYIGDNFYENFMEGNVPAVLNSYIPLRTYLDSDDFTKYVFLYSSHDYRVLKMKELLQDTGLYYEDLYNALDAECIPYFTEVLDMATHTGIYNAIQNGNSITISGHQDHARPIMCFIDGKLEPTLTETTLSGGRESIIFPADKVTATSIIILDIFEYVGQHHCFVNTNGGDLAATIDRQEFGLFKIAGADLIASQTDGTRVETGRLRFRLKLNETVIQVPETMVDWDALGITIDDPSIADRVGTDPVTGFKSIIFRYYYIPEKPNSKVTLVLMSNTGDILLTISGEMLGITGDTEAAYITGLSKYLITSEGAHLATINGERFTVDGEAADFTKKIRSDRIAITAADYTDPSNRMDVYNCNVLRYSSIAQDLSTDQFVAIDNYYGSDEADRLVGFVNGAVVSEDEVVLDFPKEINTTFNINFTKEEGYAAGDSGVIVHLPFNVDRFELDSDAHSQLNLAGTGVMCIGIHDMIFEDGLRIKNDQLIKKTNQIVQVPKPSAHYTIIRIHRDQNLYEFQDTNEQSFMDKLYKQSPGFKQNQGIF